MYFVNLLIITRIISNLFLIIKSSDFGSFVIKFIVTESYSFFGTVVNLIYLYNKYLIILFYWQIMQLLIYIIIYFLNLKKI